MLYAQVRIINAPYHIDKEYTYHLPLQLENRVCVGSVVVVPFGGANSQRNAVVTAISNKTDCKKTKPILGVPGRYMKISDEMLGLCSYISNHLFCSFGDAVKCVLPSGLGVKSVRVYSANDISTDNQIKLNLSAQNVLSFIRRNERVSETQIKKEYGQGAASCAKTLEKMGLCKSEVDFECHINEKNEKYAVLSDDESIIEKINNESIKLTPKQLGVFESLLHYESFCPVTELMQVSGAGISVINELSKKGVLRIFDVQTDRNLLALSECKDKGYDKDFDLSDEQKNALFELCKLYDTHKANAALLFGVTGSGKTNVILKLIDKVLDDNKNVIVLVPEIALTGQTVGRFAARYGEKIALIHSGLSAGERMDAWKKIDEGKAQIVIGTRSAVFAPVKNLGLIVIDEEQESSFKSDKTPKYNARDVARYRCAHNNALLVLASATPSIESYYKAMTGKYSLVTLSERYKGLQMPDVEFCDMRNVPYFEQIPDGEQKQNLCALPTTISTVLKNEIEKNLNNKEQTILFINRRGYRSFAQCHSCGHTFECPNCSVTLTHHINKKYSRDTMVCHYCGHSQPLPKICPVCKKDDSIVYMGAGTQMLESSLLRQFPEIKIARMDADTTSGKFSHEKILDAFRNGDADVLVGTQMVAKGHDFPKVSLVGIINADTSLYLNDYRANEKTFSLLTQVLGRAGRTGKRGRAVIQTYSPDNDILRLAGLQDYKAFYEREILFRKASLFPPFCDIVTVTFSGLVENDVINAVKHFGTGIDEKAKNEYPDVKFILFGPFKSEVYKVAGKYRMRFIIKCANNARFRSMLCELIAKYTRSFKEVTLSADVNPTNL